MKTHVLNALSHFKLFMLNKKDIQCYTYLKNVNIPMRFYGFYKGNQGRIS